MLPVKGMLKSSSSSASDSTHLVLPQENIIHRRQHQISESVDLIEGNPKAFAFVELLEGKPTVSASV
jgi:hypothetical protein